MLALLLLEAATSFVPLSAGGGLCTATSIGNHARMGQLRCQFKLPKIDFGGIEFEEGRETTTRLKTGPGDVQFADRDGDIITLKKSPRAPKAVDYYNGEVMKIRDAQMVQRGSGLVLSGVDRTDWKFKFFSGNFKDIIDELVEPKDPADVDRALALLE
mmetsp:Transcript_75559/g.200926  ORF Transcript_75559/g.200926 Transcript_75559/m.200926 type:complete len:158 (-) Transcript_75559:212-685(-)